MLMAEDLVMIEHLQALSEQGYDSLRMETLLESPGKIGLLGRAYRAALDDASTGAPFDRFHLDTVTDLAESGICNGWYFSTAGREYVEAAAAAAASRERRGEVVASN